jgi:hypothetical protein
VAALSAALLLLCVATKGSPAEKIVLDDSAIVTDASQPPFVQYAVEDLASYLKGITGSEVAVRNPSNVKATAAIAIGPQTARQILGPAFPAKELGEEGYLLKTARKDGIDYVVASGTAPRGTKAAVAALMKTIGVIGRSAFVFAPLDCLIRPSFAVRGMHFNGWAFNYPHTFRSWREEDWQRFLDILAYQGVNLFYLWPFMEIIPVPLSTEDRAYLEECRRVVDYAQKKHGMEVWIMQCANRVARDHCGVADPRRRPYWRPSQEDLDPGNPQHFKRIMASREALYRIVNNVDGVCNIDSDPGYLAGSPLSDYLKVFQGCRALLDCHNVHGKQAKLVHWMWFGWGLPHARAFEPDHQTRTIQLLRQQLTEPWWLVSGRFEFLPLCRQQGALEKTVLLPYGVIEAEPSYPATNVGIDAIRVAFDTHLAKYPEVRGVMGNVQTPLMQLPHLFYYTSCLSNFEYRKRSEEDVLADLARHLYPDQRDLVANGYLALKGSDPARIELLARQLEDLIAHDRLGRLGIFGRKLFPDHRIVARILLWQLRLRGARERLVHGVTPSTPKTECARLIRDYFDAYLAWDTAHGWHGLWGWNAWPLGDFTTDPRFPALAGRISKCLGTAAEAEACFGEIAIALSAKYHSKAVQAGCIAPLQKAVLAGSPVDSLAQRAKATSSVTPDPARYPPSAANDGFPATLYWPGALVQNNTEWLQLTWDRPQTIQKVIVRFLQHPSMHGRTIRLQREAAPGKWQDFAATVIPADVAAPHAVATFQLSPPVALDKIRVVNLLDLFEIEVR